MTVGQRAVGACLRAGELRDDPPPGLADPFRVVLHGRRGAVADWRTHGWLASRFAPAEAADIRGALAGGPGRVLYVPDRGRWEVVQLPLQS